MRREFSAGGGQPEWSVTALPCRACDTKTWISNPLCDGWDVVQLLSFENMGLLRICVATYSSHGDRTDSFLLFTVALLHFNHDLRTGGLSVMRSLVQIYTVSPTRKLIASTYLYFQIYHSCHCQPRPHIFQARTCCVRYFCIGLGILARRGRGWRSSLTKVHKLVLLLRFEESKQR